MSQITIDLHCDALTARPLFDGQFRAEEFRSGKASLQCLAIFTPDESAAAYAAAQNLFCSFALKKGFEPVRRYSEYAKAVNRGKKCLALTAENIGFTGGDFEVIRKLKEDGVIMASPVWNIENCLAYPNARADGGRESRGLKPLGREAIAALDGLKIIVDISHLSDGGAEEILKKRKLPVVASHSNCDAVCANPRNLTDSQLRSIADCGGVVGVNFYNRFLGGENAFVAVYSHINHIIEVAGEDTPAFGSDWDGVPEGGETVCPPDMPRLLDFLGKKGLPSRVIEKIASGNFLRVFKEVCG